ncbi:MAG: hypothetical protein ACOCZS_03665, partial [Verrucomicrobiota bacterium]
DAFEKHFRLPYFGVEDDGIQGEIQFYSARLAKFLKLGEISAVEVVTLGPHVQFLKSAIDSVAAIFYRRFQGDEIAGRRI